MKAINPRSEIKNPRFKEMWGIRIAAYCLMPNHYHLLVHTPLAKPSRSMRHVNGIYTQRYNRRKKWGWVYKQFLLSMLKPDKQASVKAYKVFMAETDDEMENVLEGKKWPSFLGSAGFAEWIKAQFYSSKIDDEVPQAKDLVPDTTRIVNAVSAFYGFSEADLYSSRRGYFNEPRNVAVYLARKLRRDTLTQLCKNFSINKYSSVSSIMGRMEKRISENETLRKNISQIKDIIQKSQGQI